MLLEKLNKEDFEKLQYLFDPKAFSEIMYSDLDNLSEWEEDKFSQIRLYQLPYLSYEYLIAEDETKTRQELFNLRRGAGTVYAQGGRLHGKCEWQSNLCLLANGELKYFGDLVGKSKNIIALDEHSWKLVRANAEFYDNGIQDCYNLVTNTGKEIIVTGNHPFLTVKGWKQIKDLKENVDFIACPRKLILKNKSNVDIRIAKLLGYFLGDGSNTMTQPGFTNICPEIINEFEVLIKSFNCILRKVGITYFVRNKIKIPFKKNPIQQIILKYRINKKSKEKEIPKIVFKWKNKYIAILLNRLFACDGHINKTNASIEITLASRTLICQIQHLLLRFGIHSNISFRKVQLNNKKFNAWRLSIYKDAKKFIDKIGIFSKDYIFDEIYRVKKIRMGDQIPHSLFFDIEKYCKGLKKRFQLRKWKLYNTCREKWHELANLVNHSDINKIAFSDIYWEKVKKIEYVGKEKTVAVYVDKFHNYISNDIISHNTLCVEKTDAPATMIFHRNFWSVLSSFDATHIRGVLELIIDIFESHPFFKLFKFKINRSPTYKITNCMGNLLESVNENITGKKPGHQWFQKHVHKTWLEESSFTTEQASRKRLMSKSELGKPIERFAGMANFSKHSPIGRIFFDMKREAQVINLPAYVNPTWTDEDDREAIEEFGGSKNSLSYRITIDGEVVEDCDSAFIIDKVRSCYNRKKEVKSFNVNKKNYYRFENELVIEKPRNAEEAYIGVDVGEGGTPTEIIIIFKINKKFHYYYNISTFQLTDEEDYEVIKFIAQKIEANNIALDTTSGKGKAIYWRLEKVFPKDNLTWVSFNEKLPIKFDKNEKGHIKTDKKGNLQYLYENVKVWSVQRLKHLFYNNLLEIYEDLKFDVEINNFVCMMSGSREIYDSKIGQDHLLQAFQCFAIGQFNIEFKEVKPIRNNTNWSTGISSWLNNRRK